MVAIAKFDRWQNTAGTVNTAVLNTVYAKSNATTYVNSVGTSIKLWDFPRITRTQSGSSFLILLEVGMGYTGSINGNPDAENPALGLYLDGYPLPTGHGNAAGYFYFTDVPFTGVGTYGGSYDVTLKRFQYMDTPTGNIGDSFGYQLWGMGNFYLGRSWSGASCQQVSSVTIMEIAQ